MCLHGLIFINACIDSSLAWGGFLSADKHGFLLMKKQCKYRNYILV